MFKTIKSVLSLLSILTLVKSLNITTCNFVSDEELFYELGGSITIRCEASEHIKKCQLFKNPNEQCTIQLKYGTHDFFPDNKCNFLHRMTNEADVHKRFCDFNLQTLNQKDSGKWYFYITDYDGKEDSRSLQLTKVKVHQNNQLHFQDPSLLHKTSFENSKACYQLGTDYMGGDIQPKTIYDVNSLEECQKKCLENIECDVWTWYSDLKNCYLKILENVTEKRPMKNAISGSTKCFEDESNNLKLPNVPPTKEPPDISQKTQTQQNLDETTQFNNKMDALPFDPKKSNEIQKPKGQRKIDETKQSNYNFVDKYHDPKKPDVIQNPEFQQKINETKQSNYKIEEISNDPKKSNEMQNPEGGQKINETKLSKYEFEDESGSENVQIIFEDQISNSNFGHGGRNMPNLNTETNVQVDEGTTAQTIDQPTKDNVGEDNNSLLYSTVGPVCGIVILIIIISCLFLFIRRKRNQNSSMSNENLVPNKPLHYSTLKPGFNDKCKPLALVDFVFKVTGKFYPERREFEKLTQADDRHHFGNDCSSGKASTNMKPKGMNRYNNILPYDKNRVILNRSINGCTYINASWIRNVSEMSNIPTFIASQGPLQHSVPHFLQMVLENNASAIVMLTKLEEHSTNSLGYTTVVNKSAQYWPPGPQRVQNFDHIQVQVLDEGTLPLMQNTVLRTLLLIDDQNLQCQVPQFHFTDWPDFGVPSSEKLIVDLVKAVRAYIATIPGSKNVIVHCSAGVGRSGTFIALYKLMQKIDSGEIEDTLDIYNEVFQLREARCQMVQKEKQYQFLYRCVAYYLQNRNIPEETDDQNYIYTLYSTN